MPKINLLGPEVSELIAAGEVVDRPASVIKELVENAIDAGATRVTVEIRRGGVTFLKVSDNGCGILREDVRNAFVRHATSKIKTADDLDSIFTLGFRGEALASIAAVSRIELITRTDGDISGTHYRAEGGRETLFADIGCPVGTSIAVEDLFYNTPARMKFLKKDLSEGNAVAGLIDRLALGNPSVAFTFLRDGVKKLQTPGDGNLLTAIRLILGTEVAAGMLPCGFSRDGIEVSGFLSKPSVSRASRSLQSFYINSRCIRSKTLVSALEEAYRNRLMGGRFPACVLNLSMDAANLDVNVHPAKLEVRFSDERRVFGAVYAACVSALDTENLPQPAPKAKITPFSLQDFDYTEKQVKLTSATQPDKPLSLADPTSGTSRLRPVSIDIEVDKKAPSPKTGRSAVTSPATAAELLFGAARTVPAPKPREGPLTGAWEDPAECSGSPPARPAAVEPRSFSVPKGTAQADAPKAAEPVSYRVIGEAFETYIIIQQGGELVLIDKHAAHERYIYEKIKHIDVSGERQQLLTPLTVTLPREEYSAVAEHTDLFRQMGFGVEDFGDGTLLVREIPMVLDGCDIADLLGQSAAKLLRSKERITPDTLDELLYSVSCRSAVMAGRRSRMPELKRLAEMVLGENGVRSCPHGRPCLLRFPRRELEKMFGRLG